MSKFFEYVKKIELSSLITESLNTFSYNLPDNRKQRLFDFYSFSSLSPLVNDIQSSELRVVKSFAPKKNEQGEASDDSTEETTSFRGARKLNENFVDSFWKAHDKCYVELAKEMMMDIFYCISAEFKHIDQDQSYRSDKLINKIPEDLREIYKSYLSNASGLNDIKVPEKKGESGNVEYNRRYNKSVSSIAMAGKSILDFAKLCSYVYDNFRFSGAYAGPKWSDAANAFIGISNALPEKYRPDSIFKPLGDLKNLKDSTGTEVPSKEESKKTKYNFDEKEFHQIYDNATLEQQQEITDLVSEIEKHFSPHDLTKSWKIVNKTTKEDIIPLEIKVNEIKGKYIFNLLLNHDDFEAYFDNKFSNVITNKFKDFLDPHKETLNKVFGTVISSNSSNVKKEDFAGIKKLFNTFNIKKFHESYDSMGMANIELKNIFDEEPSKYDGFVIEYYSFLKNVKNNINDSSTNFLKLHNKIQILLEDYTSNNKDSNLSKKLSVSDNILNELVAYIIIYNTKINEIFYDLEHLLDEIISSKLLITMKETLSKYEELLIPIYEALNSSDKSEEETSKTEETEETEHSDEKSSLLEKEKNVKIFKQKYDNAMSYEKNTIDSLIDDLKELFEDLQKQDIFIQIIHSQNGTILFTGNKPESEDILNLIVNYNNIGIIPVEGSYTSMYEEIQNTIGYYFNKCKTLLNELFGKKQTEEDAEEETSNEIVEQKSSGSYELTPKERLALFVAIDHTWGLSHNTGPTFNKLKEFTKLSNDGGGRWLIDALDKRTKDENLFRFINKNTKNSDVSQQMVSIIKRVVYSYYGATNEEELYKYVAKTNPNKKVPVHVSDVVYRYIKGYPIDDSNIIPYDIDFKSHYNYWCSLTFKVKYIPTRAVFIIAAHITDHNVTILASDKNDFSFSRDGIQSSGEYVESKNSFALKEGSTNSSVIVNTYKKTIYELFEKIKKYNGVRINPDFTSVLGDLEMSFDELKQKINLNSDISLARIAEYGDDLRNSTKVKFQIGDDGLEFIMPHVVMTFVNAERQEETPDVTYGSPDAEEYFSGKRKKPKPAPATSNIRFSFLAKPEISKTFQFTDDVSTNMKNVIYGYVSKINETEDEGLKKLQKSAVEDFQLGDTKISIINNNSDFFVRNIPEKYKKIFNISDINKGEEILMYGEHDYKITIKLDKGRLTNPYSVNLTKNEVSIIDKAYRYDSIEIIQKNLASIIEDMVSNIKDSEKEEFQNLFKSAGSNKGQARLNVGEPISPNAQTNNNGNISSNDITSDYLEFLTKYYPNIKEGSEREFYLIAISSFAKQQGNSVKDFYNNFTKLINFIYDGIQSNILNNNDLSNLESKISGKHCIIKFNLKFPLIFKFWRDRDKDPYVSIELLKKTPALYASDFFLDDYVTFQYLHINKFTFGKKIKDAFSSTENQNLNDSVNLKELLKSFLLKG